MPLTTIASPELAVAAPVQTKTVYQAYTPEDTIHMREYMLYLIHKHIERMRKYSQISDYVYDQFRKNEKEPKNFSESFYNYL